MSACGVHHLDLAKASGAFGVPSQLPYVVGSDGVGHTPDGRRVYFDGLAAPQGAWAQRTVVPEDGLLDLAEGVDDITAAALGNTGLAAWLALRWRANLQPGESVLVLGGTGALGSIAIQVANASGAGHVVAADRDPDRLQRALERGANDTVTITSEVDLVAAFRSAGGDRGFDVIIDPLWGNRQWRPCTPLPTAPATSRSDIPRARKSRCLRILCAPRDCICLGSRSCTLPWRCAVRRTWRSPSTRPPASCTWMCSRSRSHTSTRRGSNRNVVPPPNWS